MAENPGTWPSKRGPIAKIVPSDVYKRAAVPLAVEQWYHFRDFGCHLGIVGNNQANGLLREKFCSLNGRTGGYDLPQPGGDLGEFG